MLFTKKAISKALPSITHLRKRYQYYGQTGIVPANSSLLAHCVIYDKGGRVDSWVSGYGEAVPRDIYYGDYTGIDAAETVYQWMKGNITRGEVIDSIQEQIRGNNNA
jgi:hypothetical protein